MSVLKQQAKMLRALGLAFHGIAEERMPRKGKVAPEAVFPRAVVALSLGSLAQGFERAAAILEEEHEQRERMLSGDAE